MEQLPGDPITGEPHMTPSNLSWFDIVEGDGSSPAGSSTVEVHYSGWLLNGSKFDSSVDRGQTIKFQLNGVIAGWIEGVGSMKGLTPDLARGLTLLPVGPKVSAR